MTTDQNSQLSVQVVSMEQVITTADVIPEQKVLAVPRGRVGTLGILDAWRGMACLTVVLFHIDLQRNIALGKARGDGLFASIFGYGYLGVQIFFVISGYCIAGAAVNTLRRNRNPQSFLMARGRRVLPPYWISLLLIFALKFGALGLVAAGMIGSSHLPAVNPSEAGPSFYLVNFTLTSYLFKVPLASRVAWSLCYEVAFYLVVGAIIALTRSISVLFWTLHSVTIVSLAALTLFAERVPYPFDLWPQFGLGVIAFDLLNHGYTRRTSIASALTFVGLAIFMLNRNVLWPMGETSSRITFGAAAAFFLVLLVMAPFDVNFSRFSVVRWMGGIGKMSYSLYLTHFSVLAVAAILIPADAGLGWRLALMVPLSLLLAWLFFLVAERPFCTPFERASHMPPLPSES